MCFLNITKEKNNQLFFYKKIHYFEINLDFYRRFGFNFNMSKNVNELIQPYFSADNFKLFLANNLEIMKNLPCESIDMIFADPPYMLSNGGTSVHAGKRVSVNKGSWDSSQGIDCDFDFQLEWINATRRILKPNGTIWISGTMHSIFQCGFALQKTGYHIINDISWYKPNAAPNLACRSFAHAHETLLWAKKTKDSKHIFHYDIMKKNNWAGDFIKNKDSQMRSVWAISTTKASEKIFGKHPTQKPIELLKRIIMACSNENDVILDPFTGSSTTGISAIMLNRQYIGIDINQEYLDLSIKRFQALNSILTRRMI